MALVAAGLFLPVSAASAAPGDATATGLDADLNGTVTEQVGDEPPIVTPIVIDEARGAVAAPPDASANLDGAETLIDITCP